MPKAHRRTDEAVFSLRITVDGNLIPDSIDVISVEVEQGLNLVSHATVVVNALDDLTQFERGSAIEIEYSYHSKPQKPIFEGVIISHGVSINADQSLVIIECYDEAISLTTELKNATFSDMTTTDAINQILSASAARVTTDIESTTTLFPQLNQTNMTDWDFITVMALSQQLVLLNYNNLLVVHEPKVQRPKLRLTFGYDIISITASKGDAKDQDQAEVIGKVECAGNLKAKVGDSIRLTGLGIDLDGDHYISGVKHVAENGVWNTTYDLGIDLAQRQQDFEHYDLIPAEEEQPPLVTMTSDSGHSIVVDDDQNVITITTADGNRIVLNDDEQSVFLEDTHNNAVLLDENAISLVSGRDIRIEAANNITLSAGDNVIIDAQKDITLTSIDDTLVKAANATLEAAVGLNLTGAASVDLASSAQTRIVGALVTIN